MGSGFKDFSPGGILTAADVDGYLMRQTVMTFASDAARNAALASVLDEGMVVYLEDAPNRMMYYDGTTWQYLWSDAVAFTPSWSNLTVGSGTHTASYWYLGNSVHFQVLFSLGVGSAVGSTPSMTLPNSHVAVGYTAGSATYHRVSATGFWSGGWVISNGQNAVTLSGPTGTPASTAPFTWASGDNIFIGGSVRIR